MEILRLLEFSSKLYQVLLAAIDPLWWEVMSLS